MIFNTHKLPKNLIIGFGLMIGIVLLLISGYRFHPTVKSLLTYNVMQEEKTTLIVTSSPNTEQLDVLQTYVQGVMPLLLEIGGVVIKRSQVTTAYHGNQSFVFLLVMDFPSKEALVGLFESEDYKTLIPKREKGFASMQIYFANDLK